jgi:hypothetical protein
MKNNNIMATLKLELIDDRVFVPGMMVNYIYNRDDKVVTKRGVLQYVYTSYNLTKKVNSTVLKFILERTEHV